MNDTKKIISNSAEVIGKKILSENTVGRNLWIKKIENLVLCVDLIESDVADILNVLSLSKFANGLTSDIKLILKNILQKYVHFIKDYEHIMLYVIAHHENFLNISEKNVDIIINNSLGHNPSFFVANCFKHDIITDTFNFIKHVCNNYGIRICLTGFKFLIELIGSTKSAKITELYIQLVNHNFLTQKKEIETIVITIILNNTDTNLRLLSMELQSVMEFDCKVNFVNRVCENSNLLLNITYLKIAHRIITNLKISELEFLDAKCITTQLIKHTSALSDETNYSECKYVAKIFECLTKNKKIIFDKKTKELLQKQEMGNYFTSRILDYVLDFDTNGIPTISDTLFYDLIMSGKKISGTAILKTLQMFPDTLGYGRVRLMIDHAAYTMNNDEINKLCIHVCKSGTHCNFIFMFIQKIIQTTSTEIILPHELCDLIIKSGRSELFELFNVAQLFVFTENSAKLAFENPSLSVLQCLMNMKYKLDLTQLENVNAVDLDILEYLYANGIRIPEKVIAKTIKKIGLAYTIKFNDIGLKYNCHLYYFLHRNNMSYSSDTSEYRGKTVISMPSPIDLQKDDPFYRVMVYYREFSCLNHPNYVLIGHGYVKHMYNNTVVYIHNKLLVADQYCYDIAYLNFSDLDNYFKGNISNIKILEQLHGFKPTKYTIANTLHKIRLIKNYLEIKISSKQTKGSSQRLSRITFLENISNNLSTINPEQTDTELNDIYTAQSLIKKIDLLTV